MSQTSLSLLLLSCLLLAGNTCLAQVTATPSPATSDQRHKLKIRQEETGKRALQGKSRKYLAIRLTLKNSSDQAFILDGNKAAAKYSDGKCIIAAPEKDVVKATKTTLTPSEKKWLIAATATTLGLAGPAMHDYFINHDNPLAIYGEDEARRLVEGNRLGRRILLPGEEAEGAVLVPTADGVPDRVEIPMQTFPEKQDAGVFTVEVNRASGHL